MRKSLILIVAGALAAGFWLVSAHLQAADAPPKGALPIGQTCTVYLRADASGANSTNRIADLGNLIQVKGKLTEADEQWLVVSEANKDSRIARAAVLIIESPKAP